MPLSYGQRLRAHQSLFVHLLPKLILFGEQQGYSFTLGEGKVINPRKATLPDGRTTVVQDRVHMLKSLHYDGLAIDLNLFINGQYISDGGHPAWTLLGVHWESLHPDCRWGGRIRNGPSAVDSNHFSLEWEGRA